MPAFDSRFPGFWTDNPDWEETLEALERGGSVNPEESALLRQFAETGYVIIRGAISPRLAEALVADIEATGRNSSYYIARTNRQSYRAASRDVLEDPRARLIDIHVNSRLARRAMFATPIKRFLDLVFRNELLAFQTLTFRYGSQQRMHQDGAYVVVSEPSQFAASWIALEDVKKGSGELVYVPGSHRLPDFLFSGTSKSWLPKRDGQEQAGQFNRHLDTNIQSRNLERASFLPKAGDALIWAADLVHGGSKIEHRATRHSLVTHYCPTTVSPNYSKFSGHFHTVQVSPGCYISSRHYDLNKYANQTAARFLRMLPGGDRFTRLRPSFPGYGQ